MHKTSKIYVAGHNGLVGSAIVKNLRSKGYHNIIYRDLSDLDLKDTLAVAKFFKEEKPEYVILAAAKVGGIVANNTYRAEFIYDNLMIQNNVIHQSYLHGVKKLLFLGSTCIYPKNCPQPMKEEYLLTDTLEYTNEPYAIAKIAGIKMCESYNLQYGTNFISVMPTNLYGPNDNFDLEKSHVLPALIRKMHLGKALENIDWETVRKDLNKLPIEGVDGKSSEEEILSILSKYGISRTQTSTNDDTKFFPLGEDAKGSRGWSVGIWGSGKPMREFLWSEDMADACVFLMENRDFTDVAVSKSHSERSDSGMKESVSFNKDIKSKESVIPVETGIRNTHINIGTGTDISIKMLAETIKQIVGFRGELVFNSEKPDGTMKKLIDVTKLHALGWKYQIDLGRGVKKLYRWYFVKNL